MSSPNKKQKGDTVICGQKILELGQTASCDVPIEELPDMEPEILATILPEGENEGWSLVRRSDNYDIYINGGLLSVCKHLDTGDLISFETQGLKTELRFEMCKGIYDSKVGVVYYEHKKSHEIQYTSISVAVVAMIIAFFSIWHNKGNNLLRQENLDAFNSSVFLVTVDSAFLLQDTVIDGKRTQVKLESVALEQQASGTCFLTDKGLLVTARHCVEPWITDETWEGTGISQRMPKHVRLATKAETLNHIGNTDVYSVCSHCIVSNGIETYDFYSSDFKFNKTRDKVLQLGTDSSPIYWRTIMPLANRRDMELGDFAYTDKIDGITGDFSLADMNDILTFDRQSDKDIAVIGFPINDNEGGNGCVIQYGNSQHVEMDGEAKKIKGCIQMSAAINPGNSGGPVVAMIDGKIKVVAIVSKADSKATQGVFWAVPVTEVLNLYDKGGIINDSVIFRR